MNAMADMLKSLLPPGVGFSLVIFDVNKTETHFKYVSNAQRPDILRCYRELLSKWDKEAAKGN